MLDRVDDTIVAFSSPAGIGPVGILRLSGPDAFPIGDSLILAQSPVADLAGHTKLTTDIRLDNGSSLPAAVCVFRAPRSYTRQDLVELITLGSPVVLEMVRRRAIDAGARPAGPGEFTARAFLLGGMSLAAAEAVGSLVRATSDAAVRAAHGLKSSEVTSRVDRIREALTELTARVEADIDFAEEPIDFISPDELAKRLEDIAEKLSTFVDAALPTERLEVVPRILLLGPPNAGKSTLTNRLAAVQRAICAAAAGTTRDVLSVPIKLACGEAILLDAAGLDDTADGIMQQAQHHAIEAAGRVDLVCIVVDGSNVPPSTWLDQLRGLDLPRTLVVANKADLLTAQERREAHARLADWAFGPVHTVSAQSGDGIDALRARFARDVGALGTLAGNEAVLVTARQYEAARSAREAVGRAMLLASRAGAASDCSDLLAFELRDALDHIGLVTGVVATDELLERVFAGFCIGK